MGGIAAAIGGVGQGAQALGSQIRSQDFAHQENSLKRLQEQYNYLADAVERSQAHYADLDPSLANGLNDVQMKIRAAHMPGQPVDPKSFQQLQNEYFKAKQEANIAWAKHPKNPINRVIGTQAVQDAVGQATGQVPRVGGVQPVQGGGFQAPPPFQNAIAGPPPQPSAPAAQPATSPVQPAAQGGGNSSPATFPTTPVQPVEAPGAAAVSPDGRASAGPVSDASVPTLSTSTSGASVAPIIDLDSLLARPLAGSLETGYMSPLIHEALTHQMGTQAALEQAHRMGGVNLQLGKNKIEAAQPYLDDLKANPDHFMQDLIPIEALMGGNAGLALAPLLNALTPQSEPGMTTARSIELSQPGWLAAHGLTNPDGSPLDPNTPMRVQVNKFSRIPVSAQISSVADQIHTIGADVFEYNPRTHQLEKIQGVTPTSMLPSLSVKQVPGQLPESTRTQRIAPSGVSFPGGSTTAPAGGVPPVQAPSGVPPVAAPGRVNAQPAKPKAATSAAATPVPTSTATSSVAHDPVIAANYDHWIRGGTLSEKDQVAARLYAHDNHLAVPDDLSPAGQEGVYKVMPILKEILHARTQLYDEGLTDKSITGRAATKAKLAAAWVAYDTLHFSTPLTETISNLSFDSLRSTGQALQNTGVRALPIFKLGQEHTPIFSKNPDDGYGMDLKLQGMQRRAAESLIQAQGMSKSGILPGVGVIKAMPVMVERRSDKVRGLLDPFKFDPAVYRYVEDQ